MDQNKLPLEPMPGSSPGQLYGVPPSISSGRSPNGPHHKSLVTAIIATILAVIFLVLFVWAYQKYINQRDDVQAQIDSAVDQALVEKTQNLEAEFETERNSVTDTFRTNDSIANVSFAYPKHWSQYLVENERSTTQIEAIFHPEVVQKDKVYALRLKIIQSNYDDVLDDFQTRIKRGEVKATPIKSNNISGVRLEGAYERDRNGSLVLFPIRDKTLFLSTESTDYSKAYESIIQSLSFTP